MIKHKVTFYPDYTIKTFSEYSEDVLVLYEEYNKHGLIIFSEDITGETKKFEYDTKKRIKRAYHKDKVGNIYWKKYSYSKENITILHRRQDPFGLIHKMIFGPENEDGERPLIKERFI